ncbi:MAG: DUF92 domain-containing protein [Gemmatimonadales bacterium]
MSATIEPLLQLAVLVLVVTAAWRAGALTGSGALAASGVGGAVLAGTGWAGGLVLAVFFLTSTTLSRLITPRALPVGDAKSDRRDGWQVVANGGAAAVGALGEWLLPGAGIWIVTCALAAAAADTWATTLGGLSRQPPRLLLSGAVVPPGTNGGVSWAGSLGGAAGAVVVAACGALLATSVALCIAAACVGVAGMLLDSAVGERWQGRFQCPTCLEASERRRHRCGAQTIAAGGVSWLTNDGVNALTTFAAGAAGLVAWRWWG